MNTQYNCKDKKSIIAYAKRLISNSLRDVCKNTPNAVGGKGNFGQTLEKYYFGYEPNSRPEPDFAEAGLELKSTPLKKLKNSHYVAKERLVLNIINYEELIGQQFDSSDFLHKNADLLLVFYLYDQARNFLDYKIHIVDEWEFQKTDLAIIQKDWEFIRGKVDAGKAHELSEGDTFYLGACTKGANSKTLRNQPKSKEKAKQRAFSFKMSYVNHIINSLTNGVEKTTSLLAEEKKESIEEAIEAKFTKYYGKTTTEIQNELHIKTNKDSKQFYSLLTKQIGLYEEIDKAGITVKTVVLPKENNKPPKESMSFPAFKYTDIVHETWETSSLRTILDSSKFLFVFFQDTDNGVVMRGIKMWNMPYKDIVRAKSVWLTTQNIIKEGKIVAATSTAGRRKTNFPHITPTSPIHVRPHAKTTSDTYPLPVADQITQANVYTKHSFWMNSSYILSIYQNRT